MTDTYLVKTSAGLQPVDDHTREQLAYFGDGECFRVKIYRDRNIRHHRLFFGILNLVFANQEKYLSQEGLFFAVKVQAGYVEEIKLKGDAVMLKPRSIAFSAMTQSEFSDFYAAALKAIVELLPQFAGVNLEDALISGDL